MRKSAVSSLLAGAMALGVVSAAGTPALGFGLHKKAKAPVTDPPAGPVKVIDPTSLSKTPFPAYTTTKKGTQGDPVNLILIGQQARLEAVFAKAGWIKADPRKIGSELKMLRSAVFKKGYTQAPFSDLFLFGHSQQMAYEKNSQKLSQRDHFRVWRAPARSPDGEPYWCVQVSRDIGVKFIPGTDKVTHEVSPFVDDERDKLLSDLQHSGAVEWHKAVAAASPNYCQHYVRTLNGGGDYILSDGKVEVVRLEREGSKK